MDGRVLADVAVATKSKGMAASVNSKSQGMLYRSERRALGLMSARCGTYRRNAHQPLVHSPQEMSRTMNYRRTRMLDNDQLSELQGMRESVCLTRPAPLSEQYA